MLYYYILYKWNFNPYLYFICNNILLRSIVVFFISLVLTLISFSKLLLFFKSRKNFIQPIRNDGPISHKTKFGTPTMGGTVVVGAIVFSVVLFSDITNYMIYVSLFVLVSFGILGFIDDFIKTKYLNSNGMIWNIKLIIQVIISTIVCVYIHYFTNFSSFIFIPYLGNINFNTYYILFSIFIITSSSNSVNITDGLDGLAIMLIVVLSITFFIICYFSALSYELCIIYAAILGSCLGCLWFNTYPADIFIGDIGSLSIGALLGVLAIFSKQEIIFAIVSGLFIIESLSVIIQVSYFKFTSGRRIFKMSPIHHHFEKLGLAEPKIVLRFFIVSIIFAITGLFVVYTGSF